MTSSPFLPDAALLERYLAGECTPGEATAIQEWIVAEESRRKTALGLKSLDATWVDRALATDVEALWERVVARALGVRPMTTATRTYDTVPVDTVSVSRGRSRVMSRERGTLPRARRYAVATIAAAAAVLVVVAGWAMTRRVATRLPAAMESYATGKGERATITLADGSTVVLNVDSRVEVPVNFAAGNRTVRLIGEALFTVAHHAGGVFTVQSGPTTTRVLGTSFVVRRYRTDTATIVAVRDGKVAVGRVTVPAARLAEIGSDGTPHVRPAGAAPFAFASGVLALQDMSLRQAIPELDRWYDADIRLGDSSLATQAVKGYLPAGSLADLTELLSTAFDAQVVRDGRVLTLYHR